MAEYKSANNASIVLATIGKLIPDIEVLYKDIHAHPELSMQEMRTAGIAADRLKKAGYEVTTGMGETGMVGLPARALLDGRRGDCPVQHSIAPGARLS